MVKIRMEASEAGVTKSTKCDTFSLQCSDTVGWATGSASGCKKLGGLTGALRTLQLQFYHHLHQLCSNKISNSGILVSAYLGYPGKWPD